MKFLLGYNMKIVVLLEDKNLVGVFFLVEEDSKGCAHDEILVE